MSELTTSSAAEAIQGLIGNAEPAPETHEPPAHAEPVDQGEEATAAEEVELEEADAEEEYSEDEDYEEGDLDEEEAAEDEPDVDEQDETEEPTFPVKVNGKEYDVTLDDLKSGYQKSADYTRKTEELAEQRRSVEAQGQELATVRQQYDENLQLVQQILHGQAPDPKEMVRLAEEDPDEFTRMQAREMQRQEALKAFEAERQKVAEAHAKDLAVLKEKETEKLVAAVPELGTKDGQANLTGFLMESGYTEDEIKTVFDHRALVTAWKAYQFDQMAKAKKASPDKQARPIPKVTKKGRGPQDKAARKQLAVTKKKNRLKQTGHVKDAAAVIAERYR